MTHSMTGFSRVQAEGDLGALSIEIKSVNSRYLDCYFKMPESIKAFEPELRKRLGQRLSRGKVECYIRFYANAQEHLSLDENYIKALITAAKQLAETHQINNVGVGELLKLPGVLIEKPADSTALKAWFLPLFEQALDDLLQQRKNEGKHLSQLIKERLASVKSIIQATEIDYDQSSEKVKQKLHEKLADLAEQYQSQIDEPRFEQEMIYLLQKMDIAEEIDRLKGHVAAAEKLLGNEQPIGRKLDFLMQEMNREANTIASKSQHLGLTLNAVELKVLLEQIREQIQNIE